MLVAHYLGADHVGHSFHVRHPEMRRKLEDYADVVRMAMSVLSADPEHADTLLLVFGDHGAWERGAAEFEHLRFFSLVCSDESETGASLLAPAF